MKTPPLKQLHAAMRHLNPDNIRKLADRNFTIGLMAADEEGHNRMVQFLLPPRVSERKAQEAAAHILRVQSEDDFDRCDFGLADPHLDCPPHFYRFQPPDGSRAVARFLDEQEHLWISVARHFVAFQGPVIERLITKVARENALVVAAAALPRVAMRMLPFPLTMGEFVPESAALTMNQIRLAFLIAAASDSPLGYSEQKAQIASIIAAAVGWRALGRKLASRVPTAGGLLSKGIVAFAGTCVVGLGLERYSKIGCGLTAVEKREHYSRAYAQGRVVMGRILDSWRGKAPLAAGA